MAYDIRIDCLETRTERKGSNIYAIEGDIGKIETSLATILEKVNDSGRKIADIDNKVNEIILDSKVAEANIKNAFKNHDERLEKLENKGS